MGLMQDYLMISVTGITLGLAFGYMTYKLAIFRNKRKIIKKSLKANDPESKITIGGKTYKLGDLDIKVGDEDTISNQVSKVVEKVNPILNEVKKEEEIKGNETAQVEVKKEEKPIISTEGDEKELLKTKEIQKETKESIMEDIEMADIPRIRIPTRKQLEGGKK